MIRTCCGAAARRRNLRQGSTPVPVSPISCVAQWLSISAISTIRRRSSTEAEALSPNSADFLVQHADALCCFGDNKSGWEHFERAIDLNPYAPDHYWWVGGTILLHQQEFARAIEMCGRMESDVTVLRILTASHALLGNMAEAREYGRRMKEFYPNVEASNRRHDRAVQGSKLPAD